MSYLFNNSIKYDRNAVDAFNRLKVSSPFTLFESQNIYQDNGKFDTSLTGGAVAQYQSDDSVMSLNVYGTNGDQVIRQSYRNFAYQPGKSLLAISSYVFSPAISGLRQRVGYFDSNNGVYLQLNDTSLSIVLRSYSSGSLVETSVNYSSWNGDPCDGTGKSGFDIDVTKANIFWVDIEWLGVGNVRCGFFHDGEPVLAHTFKNINSVSTTYMSTASLPVRYEISNTSNIGTSSSMLQICSTVISEGGYEINSFRSHITRGGTNASSQTLTTAGTFYPTVSIRLNSNRINSVVIASQIDILTLSSASAEWKLLLNATLSGSSFVTHSNQRVDYDISSTSLSSGTSLASGFVSSKSLISFGGNERWSYQIGKTISGTSDILTLAVSPFSNGDKVSTMMSWEEIS